MAYKLTKEQKEAYRRLTQKANRRIDKAFKEYESSGMKLVPKALTGGLQHKSEWASPKYALSRSTKFATPREFKNAMDWLRQFDTPSDKGGIPTFTEYQKINASKIKMALNTAMQGKNFMGLPDEFNAALMEKIDKMDPIQQAQFWKKFEKIGKKMVDEYDSEQALNQAIKEFFWKEELKPMLIDSIVEAESSGDPKADRKRAQQLKYMGDQMLIKYLKAVSNGNGKKR